MPKIQKCDLLQPITFWGSKCSKWLHQETKQDNSNNNNKYKAKQNKSHAKKQTNKSKTTRVVYNLILKK